MFQHRLKHAATDLGTDEKLDLALNFAPGGWPSKCPELAAGEGQNQPQLRIMRGYGSQVNEKKGSDHVGTAAPGCPSTKLDQVLLVAKAAELLLRWTAEAAVPTRPVQAIKKRPEDSGL